MIGNSMRSDIEPVVALGGRGIYMPYHSTWAHEAVTTQVCDPDRIIEVDQPSEIPDALDRLEQCTP